MKLDHEVEAMASMLGPGQHTGLCCPACRHADNAMSMKVDPPSVKAICHRASCGYKYWSGSARWESLGAVVRPSRVRPYTGPLRPLETADYLWFQRRFELPMNTLREVRKSESRYYLQILGPEGKRRGWVGRSPWEGSPLCGPIVEPKVLTYMDNDEPVQHWTGWSNSRPLVLVEDQISALRVTCDADLPAVALLGTGVNEEKVAELQRHAKHIVFALDADATGQAFSHARKWGQAFDSCRVVILREDIKDMRPEEVRELFT